MSYDYLLAVDDIIEAVLEEGAKLSIEHDMDRSLP